jgi:hypothetical protein
MEFFHEDICYSPSLINSKKQNAETATIGWFFDEDVYLSGKGQGASERKVEAEKM